MVDYIILLALNSLSIIAIYLLLQPEGLFSSFGSWLDRLLSAKIHPDKEDEIIAKGLWARRNANRNLIYAYYPIWKTIKGCVTCMASIWGTIGFSYAIFLDFRPLDWNLLYILPVYLLALAGLNRILSVSADL